MYTRILLTNDGSPLATAAIPYVAALAHGTASEVVVLRVSRSAGIAPETLHDSSWAIAMADNAAMEAEPLLRDVAIRLRSAGVARVGTLVLRGDPGPAIVQTALRLGASLVVMASHGLSGMRHTALGSVAEYVVRHLRVAPVLVCHPLPPGIQAPLAQIAVAVDESPLALAVVAHAESIVHDTSGAVVLVGAIESVNTVIATTTPLIAGQGVPRPPYRAAAAIVARERAAVRSRLSEVATLLRHAGARDVRIEVVERRVAEAVLDVARRCECHLVVMGAHSRNGIERGILGSAADDVMRNLEDGAVLLVRTPIDHNDPATRRGRTP